MIRILAALWLVSMTLVGVATSGAAFTRQTTNPSNSTSTLLVQPPGGVSASSGAGGAVSMSWTATPTSPGVGHILSYLVLRAPAGGTYSQIASTDASTLTYTDTPAVDGTYSYVVRAQVSGTGAFTSVNSIAGTAYSDRTAPSVAVSYPVSGGNYTGNTWGGTISGTATDATSGISGASSICVTITTQTGLTWNGSAFVNGSSCVSVSSYNASTGSWTYAFAAASFPANASYMVAARATDNVGNVGTSSTNTFSYAASQGGWTYVATGAPASRSSSGTLTVPVPSGSTNDLLLLIEVNSANQQISTPTGWTLLADQGTNSPSQFRFTVWWKAAGSETSVALSVHTNGSGTTAWVARYTRAAGTAPVLAGTSVQQGVAATGSSMTPTSDLTTNGSDATVISLVSVRAANALSLSTARGFSSEFATTTAQGTALALGDLFVAASGTTVASPTWSQGGTPAQWAWATAAFD